MRRNDREIKDRAEILAVMRRCAVCHLALNDADGYPYVLPLNYGIEEKDGQVVLYFHSALAGKKLDLLARDSRAAFAVDTKHQLQYFEEKGYCTYAYESVLGRGRLRLLAEEEKAAALDALMEHYHPGEHAYYNPAAIPRTAVYALEVEEMTGKRKLPK